MHLLRPKCLYTISQNLSYYNILRCYSSASDKAAARKDLHFVNKSLYGAVTPKPKPKPQQHNPDELPAEVGTISTPNPKTCAGDYHSEMYWMLEHKPIKPVIPIKKSVIKPIKSSLTSQKETKNQGKQLKATTNSVTTQKALKYKSEKAVLDVGTPTVFTQFNDSLCKPPLKQASKKLNAKVRNNDDCLRDILAVPPFDLSNWCSDVDGLVVGNDRMEVRQMPSVGKVLQATMSNSSRKALMQWKLLKIAELGKQGFEELQQSHLSAGSNFHTAIQNYFHTKLTPDAKSPESKIWTSVESVLHDIDADTELVESPIVHPVLQYKGIVDCVSRVGGQLSVIEWKKSDRIKDTISSTFDAPLQLCAYLGAINADPRYSLEVRNGLVVVAYTSGGPANAFRMDEKMVQTYWRAWLKRLHEYWVRDRDGTLPEPI